MSQTMLAILALAMLGMFALRQYEGIAHTRQSMIVAEIVTQSSGVAVDRLEEIGSMQYDEKIGQAGGAKLLLPTSLTASANFKNDAPGNDIDDFDDVVVDTFRVSGADTLWFRVQSFVAYALDAHPDQQAPTQTKVKMVTVKVNSLDLDQPDTLSITQSFACGSRCGW